MKLQLKKLMSDSKEKEQLEQINIEAFPPSERMSVKEIFSFAADTNTDVLGIYEEELLIGFAVLLKNEECGYLYYFAIDKKFRSKGYGGAALQKIMTEYSKLQIILDFEEINSQAENNPQRIRRKNFYLRNGLHETGQYTLLLEQRFEVVCNGGELLKEAFQELLYIIHAYRPEFPALLIS